MKIISRRERITTVQHRLVYDYIDSPGWGFSFDCDEDGLPLPSLCPEALHNLRLCVLGTMKPPVRKLGIQTFSHSYTQPAIGLCNHCGEEVVLEGFTCTCSGCQADYNSAGQELASRSQWGEETGESLSDILSIP